MRIWLVIGALCGALAVIAGSLGEHELASRLDAHALSVWQTAAQYQMFHALAIGLAALTMCVSRVWAGRAAALFLIGIVMFSGSLYLWALTGSRVVVFMPPLGGLAFIIGWLSLAVAGWKSEDK